MPPFPPGGSSMPPFPPGGRAMSPPFNQSAPFPPGGMIDKPVYTSDDHPPVHSQEKLNASLKSQRRRRTSAQKEWRLVISYPVHVLCHNKLISF